MRQIGVVLLPLLQRDTPAEQALPEGAVGVLAIPRPENQCVEVHFHFEVGAPIFPTRFSTVQGEARYSGARHFVSYKWIGQPWHVLVEDEGQD